WRLKGFFKDPGNLRYSLNTSIPVVAFLTSLFSLVIGLNVVVSARGNMVWFWIFGVCFFSALCALIVVRAIMQPINDLVKKAESYVRLEEFRKERGQMLEVYKIIERLMDHVQRRADENERTGLIESMEKLDYIIPLGYMSLMVAHEVRNPLNTITGMSELLQQKITDESQRLYIAAMLDASKKIDVFTRELLDFTDNELLSEELNVYEIIEEAVETIEESYQDVRIDYSKKGNVTCFADRMKLYQVIHNILKNAAGYEKDGGTVKIEVKQDKENIYVIISNRNSRIQPDDINSIFKPFFTRKKEGKGLGLFIGMRNMKLHGGDIKVESSEAGTAFTVVMPCYSTHARSLKKEQKAASA
ncbi:MAG: HAMP domain-containing sensor histidine kinase, partial [Syntrophorhabdus sp.]